MGKTSSAAIVSEIWNIEQLDSYIKLESYGGTSPDIKGSTRKIGKNKHLTDKILTINSK